jgi:hypothetical protein
MDFYNSLYICCICTVTSSILGFLFVDKIQGLTLATQVFCCTPSPHCGTFKKELYLNSGLWACKTCAVQPEPHLQFILLWLFWSWDLKNYLLGLALYHDPSSLSLPSSKMAGENHWHLAKGTFFFFLNTLVILFLFWFIYIFILLC